MNELDALYFFLMQSLTSTPANQIHYYYDRPSDAVFSAMVYDKKIKLSFRNEYTREKNEKNLNLNTAVHKLTAGIGGILELPRLSFQEKITFLEGFIQRAQEEKFKEILIYHINRFTEISDFEFTIELKKLDFQLALDFDILRGRFLHQKIQEYYTPLGINENTLLLW